MKTKYLYTCLLLISISCHSQDVYSDKEKSFIDLFNNFKSFIKTKAVDSVGLNFIIQHYVFTGSKNGKLTPGQHESIHKQLNSFRSYLLGKYSDNIRAIPMRFAQNTSVYNAMTDFQKENCLAYVDKHDNSKILGYILFIPVVKGVSTEPRIWSWVLTYQFGKYLFRSVTGEDGYEYMFTPK